MKKKTDKFRKPYYELSDAVYDIQKSTNEVDDEKLKILSKKLVKLQDEIYNHLQSNYIWD